MVGRNMNWILCTGVSLTLLVVVSFIEVVMGEKCLRDESLGDRDGNVYYCESKDLPQCCTEDGERTCCMDEDEKNLHEQLQLWGTVAAMILVIAILFVCCKNDVSFCNSESSLRERWDNFRNKNKKAHLVENEAAPRGEYYDNPLGGFGGPSRYPGNEPYNFPPLSTSEKVNNCNTYDTPRA